MAKDVALVLSSGGARVLVDIQMSRYGGFDYDKSEKLIAIGRKKTQQALANNDVE